MDTPREVGNLCAGGICVGSPICVCHGTGQTCCLKAKFKDRAPCATFQLPTVTLVWHHPAGSKQDGYLRMLRDSPDATMEVQLLASPTLACRQAWSKKHSSYLWQGAFPTLSKESVSAPLLQSTCKQSPFAPRELLCGYWQNLAQPEAANGTKLFPLQYHVLGQNVYGDLCIHPVFNPLLPSFMVVHRSLHKLFGGLGGEVGRGPQPLFFCKCLLQLQHWGQSVH